MKKEHNWNRNPYAHGDIARVSHTLDIGAWRLQIEGEPNDVANNFEWAVILVGEFPRVVLSGHSNINLADTKSMMIAIVENLGVDR